MFKFTYFKTNHKTVSYLCMSKNIDKFNIRNIFNFIKTSIKNIR